MAPCELGPPPPFQLVDDANKTQTRFRQRISINAVSWTTGLDYDVNQ